MSELKLPLLRFERARDPLSLSDDAEPTHTQFLVLLQVSVRQSFAKNHARARSQADELI